MSNIELYDKLIKCGYTDLWLPEMEFLMHDQMEYRKHLWNDTLYMDEMTVFAIDGYGNLFAWRDDDSVVFIDVGPQTCEVFSLNLADAIYSLSTYTYDFLIINPNFFTNYTHLIDFCYKGIGVRQKALMDKTFNMFSLFITK